MFDWDEIDNFFNETKAETGTGDKKTVPDGAYLANVEKAEYRQSKLKGTPYINLSLQIIEGAYCDRYVFKEWWLTKGALPYVKADLNMCGFEGMLSDFQDPKNLEFLLDKKLRISVKTRRNGEYNDIQVYLNGCLTAEESGQFKKTNVGSVTEEEMPF